MATWKRTRLSFKALWRAHANVTIYISSFKRSSRYPGEKFSVATFQPTGYNYSQLAVLAPYGCDGRRLRFSMFPENPKEEYEKAFRAAYKSRWVHIKKWMNSISSDIVLCCWCPYSSSAKEQIKQHGYFCCHNGLIAKMLVRHRPDLEIVLDEKHQALLYEKWHPFPNKITQEPTYDELSF